MKDHENLALKFCGHIVRQEWEAAHSLLSVELQSSISLKDLEQEVCRMIAYAKDEIAEAEIVLEIQDWPEKQSDDIGWVYVSLSGSTFSEAATVVVKSENGLLAVRSLEWGRP